MENEKLTIKILRMEILPSREDKRFLAYFDCDFGFVQLYSCLLSVSRDNEVLASGPLTQHNGVRAAYISNRSVLIRIRDIAIGMYQAAGGQFPEDVTVPKARVR